MRRPVFSTLAALVVLGMSGAAQAATEGPSIATMPRDEIVRLIKDLEGQMRKAAKDLEYERAAVLRDQIVELRRAMLD